MADSVSGGLAVSLRLKPRPVPAIVVGGLIVGVLDLTYAILVYSPKEPILIPQTIPSGLLGMKSYSGGARTAALGIALHPNIVLPTPILDYPPTPNPPM